MDQDQGLAESDLSALHAALASQRLRDAEDCISQNRWAEAFFNYLLVLRLSPAKKEELKDNFTSALRHLGEECEQDGRIEELMTCYQHAYELFPECETVVSNLGAQLFRLGYLDEAASYFHKALRINPSFTQAQENLENLFGHLVERWHFRMLNDRNRNKAFQNAIERAVKSGYSTVLDIGTGTGLLALFAASAGAKKVYACEVSRTMFETAQDVVSANFMPHLVNLINKKSTDLIIGEDLPEKVNLIVTETFDCGILGEGILSTMKHALQNLVKESGPVQVIPASASIYVTAIESESVRKEHRFLFKGLYDLDLSATSVFSHVGVPLQSPLQPHHEAPSDPYTTERLKDMHSGYKELSERAKAFNVSFNSLQEIDSLCMGMLKPLQLKITKPGRLDALMMTFELCLDPHSTLTSSPDEESCWEQALFPVHPHHVSDRPELENLCVHPGSSLDVTLQCTNHIFSLKCDKILRKISPSLPLPQPNPTPPYYLFLSPADIMTLNSIDYNASCCRALKKLISTLEDRNLASKIMFMPQSVSLLPLQAVKFGAQGAMVLGQNSVQQVLIRRAALINRIDFAKMVIKNERENLESVAYAISEEKAQCGASTWNGLYVDFVDIYGCMRQRALEDIALARMACLGDCGLVMPHQVKVYGVFIESFDLIKDSSLVSNELTMDYQILQFINIFQMSTHEDIHFSTLKHQRLSEPFEIFTFSLNQPLTTSDDLKSFLNHSSDTTVTCNHHGHLHAIVYWFDMTLVDGITVSTLSPKYHYRQAAAICKDQRLVSDGTIFNVKASCQNSSLSFSLTMTNEL